MDCEVVKGEWRKYCDIKARSGSKIGGATYRIIKIFCNAYDEIRRAIPSRKVDIKYFVKSS
jgi:hypothetical protein